VSNLKFTKTTPTSILSHLLSISCKYEELDGPFIDAIVSTKMGIVSLITGYVAPMFIIVSPITSYADQTYAIHRTKSSAGFSMDIPLIMLVASLLRYGSLIQRIREKGLLEG
jgi:hypothetical protein